MNKCASQCLEFQIKTDFRSITENNKFMFEKAKFAITYDFFN